VGRCRPLSSVPGAARGVVLALKGPLAGLTTGGGELAPRARELLGMLDRLKGVAFSEVVPGWLYRGGSGCREG
jgi:hypothetical protein